MKSLTDHANFFWEAACGFSAPQIPHAITKPATSTFHTCGGRDGPSLLMPVTNSQLFPNVS